MAITWHALMYYSRTSAFSYPSPLGIHAIIRNRRGVNTYPGSLGPNSAHGGAAILKETEL
jgi:hypothetical protein